MTEVVITEFMADAAVERLRERYEVLYDPDLYARRADLLDRVAAARALVVRNQTAVDAELIGAAPRLVVVGRLGVGLDNIDLAACRARDIAVHPATGANSVAVAEYVVGAMLMLLRGVVGVSGRVAAGEWPRIELAGREAAAKRLGLVGFGRIARLVAARAVALEMEVAAYDPYLPAGDPAWRDATAIDRTELLHTSDVVSIHVPLTDDTRNLVDAAALAAMRPGAIVINSSRGGIVDEEALVDALRSGHLGGAALDVFEVEPPPAGRFGGVPNLLLTPHIAGVTTESNHRVSFLTAEHVIRALG